MFIIVAAIASALVSVAPYALRGYKRAALYFPIAAIVLWAFYYLSMPSTVWPMWGIPGIATLVLMTASAIGVAFLDGRGTGRWGDDTPRLSWVSMLPVVGWGYLLFTLIAGSAMFHAETYAKMTGAIEEREWTTEVQPKDPKHMRWVTYANAAALAQKAIGTAGKIGSQFGLDQGHMALQRVKGELVYAIPVDFAGFTPWLNTEGAPGFMVVHAEDPERQPRFVQLPKGKEMRCTSGAFLNNNLTRLLRNNGFLNDGLASARFELDENEKPWYVIATYKPTVQWWGEKVTSVAIVDPVTCAITRYAPDQVPEWVDRVYPSRVLENYLAWSGLYSKGWLNSWWGRSQLTEPEKAILIYGSDDRAEWAMGITSTNNADDSLISVVFADSRTGKMVNYRVKGGGATETAIVKAINANAQVKFRHLHAKDVQLYNVFGIVAAVAPLLNDQNLFQGAAIVPINNVQDVAVGTTTMEAVHNFQVLMSRRGQQIALDKTSVLKKVIDVVMRIRQDINPSGSVYHILLKEVPHILTGSSQDHAKLPLTQAGDTVVIEYIDSDQLVVPMRSFDNATLLGTAKR